ncbi:MAG TPA: glycoside hydrolase family 3 N-terminal domain-containing protein, partial [Anaerolineales bacterium]
PAYIPLLIGLSQPGDGAPDDQILNGLTPLPSEMALGATWDPNLAAQAGTILGQELNALGVNLLFGPSLDVLGKPNPQGSGGLDTGAFGGDPFWVGKMGSAYIQGVHQGSQDRVMVAAQHFPGQGASDRPPEEEVATVRKTLDELEQADLVPFFKVTGGATTSDTIADALVSTQIRYQGFQGNVRPATRPFSFDPQAFSQLMELPALQKWRSSGGVMISDDLGSRAIRRFYEANQQIFNMPNRVAINAFQAGNDLLYVADFSYGETDSYTSALQTLQFFAQRYREDHAFAEQVDQSVLRILTLKYRLYNNFSLGLVNAPSNLNTAVGNSGQFTFQVAQQAATLISPSLAELSNSLPDAPNLSDRIVFISDIRTAQQCGKCLQQSVLGVKDLEQVVLKRYGTQGVSPNNLGSYSLNDLKQVMDSGKGDSQFERDLSRANWLVFAMLRPTPDDASFAILSRFLSEQPDLYQQKRLIVFAFSAPYYLDATNIYKLSAYYTLYSKTPQFIDMAAYLLFQQLPPRGHLPVSVPEISYDLNQVLAPDPLQNIQIRLDIGGNITETTATPQPSTIPFRIGDVIPIRTSLIVDHNGYPVKDGTPIEFTLSIGGETSVTNPATTIDGIARTTFLVANSGTLEIRAQSEQSKSEPLRIDIAPPNGTVLPPPTSTPTPTRTPTQTPRPTIAPLPTPSLTANAPNRPQFIDWLIAILVTLAIAFSSYQLSAMLGQMRWGLRGGLMALIGGLLAYSYLALQLPGSERLVHDSMSRSVLLVTLVGSGTGLVLAWLWRLVLPHEGHEQT